MSFVARSVLWELRHLETLQLSGTGATRLCDDWRHGMPALQRLHLIDNNVTALLLPDITWPQRNLTVDLSGNPIESIVLYPSEPSTLQHRSEPPEVRKRVQTRITARF